LQVSNNSITFASSSNSKDTIIMEDNKQSQGGLQFELNPEVAQGKYANLALITHSSSDFILDFASMMPGVPKAHVQSRVIMAPEHAKRLLMALQDNIMKYEQVFGPIQIPNQPQQDRTISPFDKQNNI
jgi:hypothetical protein